MKDEIEGIIHNLEKIVEAISYGEITRSDLESRLDSEIQALKDSEILKLFDK